MNKLTALGLATVTFGFGIIYIAGNQAPHDVRYSGVVLAEKDLYGDIVRGYTTEGKGLQRKVENTFHALLGHGSSMNLYVLELRTKEYDTMRWFKKEHHTEQFSRSDAPNGVFDPSMRDNRLYLQSRGDIADVGQRFSTTSLADLGPIFSALGIRYQVSDTHGKEKTLTIQHIIKNTSAFTFE